MADTRQTVIQREAPDIEAMKIGLMEQAKALTSAPPTGGLPQRQFTGTPAGVRESSRQLLTGQGPFEGQGIGSYGDYLDRGAGYGALGAQNITAGADRAAGYLGGVGAAQQLAQAGVPEAVSMQRQGADQAGFGAMLGLSGAQRFNPMGDFFPKPIYGDPRIGLNQAQGQGAARQMPFPGPGPRPFPRPFPPYPGGGGGVAPYRAVMEGTGRFQGQDIGGQEQFAERGALGGQQQFGGLQSLPGQQQFAERGALGGQAGFDPTTGIGAYFSPYQDAVVQQTLADIGRQGDIQQRQLDAQAVQAGAFGGSRQAVAQRELDRNVLEQQARAAGQLRSQGYQQAAQMAQQGFEQQQQRALQGTGQERQMAQQAFEQAQQRQLQGSGQEQQLAAQTFEQAQQRQLQGSGQERQMAQQAFEQAQQRALQGTGQQAQLAQQAFEDQQRRLAGASTTALGAAQQAFQQQQQRMQQAGAQQMQAGGQQMQAGRNIGDLYRTTGQTVGQLGIGAGQATGQLGVAAGQALGQLGVQQGALGELQSKLRGQDLQQATGYGQIYRGIDKEQAETQRLNALQNVYEPYQRLSYYSDILRGAPSTQQTLSLSSSPSPSLLNQVVGSGIAGIGLAQGAKRGGII